MTLPRRRFWKMTGSGNDFVFFDARDEPPGVLESTDAIGAVCDRRLGVGADEAADEAADALTRPRARLRVRRSGGPEPRRRLAASARGCGA